jgi:membrane protease YdiL (CAAX protease family)
MTDFDLITAMKFFAIADGVLLAICLLIGFLLRWVLRRLDPAPRSIGRSWWRQFLEGVVVAVLVLTVTLVPSWLAGGFANGPGWQPFDEVGVLFGLAMTWLLFALQSLMEELAFRGVAMALVASVLLALAQLVLRRRGFDPGAVAGRRAWLWSGLLTNVAISSVFALAHADNPNVTLVAVFNVALASLVLGQLMWNQASILGAWALHWLWNASIVTLGFPISGVRLPPPVAGFGATGARDGLLTGGQFGPEGSIPCAIALGGAFVLLVLQSARSAAPESPSTEPAADHSSSG